MHARAAGPSTERPAPTAGGRRLHRSTYHADSALDAQAQLEALARELDKTPTPAPPAACARACPRR